MLASIGFDVRAPELSPHAARPSLHMFTEARPGSTVGAQQLSAVTWSVVFDDVELSAAEIARLARQARPMVESHGRWVAIDRLDLERAAAALSEREADHPADRCRDPAPEHRSRWVRTRRWRRRPRRQLGHERSSTARTIRRWRSTSRPSTSPARSARTRRRRWHGSDSSTPASSAGASPSTWGSARHRRCWPTSRAPLRAAPRS